MIVTSFVVVFVAGRNIVSILLYFLRDRILFLFTIMFYDLVFVYVNLSLLLPSMLVLCCFHQTVFCSSRLLNSCMEWLIARLYVYTAQISSLSPFRFGCLSVRMVCALAHINTCNY